MKSKLTCNICKTEQEAILFCAEKNAELSAYMRKKHPAHYTTIVWNDGSIGYICWYRYNV